jgi:hypothetical protein
LRVWRLSIIFKSKFLFSEVAKTLRGKNYFKNIYMSSIRCVSFEVPITQAEIMTRK